MGKTVNPNEVEKTVVLTLSMTADNMSELYGRIAQVVSSAENSADVVSVSVEDKKVKIQGPTMRGIL